MLLNVFVPHVAAAIMFRGYAPGLVTALLVNLPVMALLSWRAVRVRYVSGWKAVAYAIVVPMGIVALSPVLFAVGRWIVWR